MFSLRDDDPDYPAMVMGNYILGSGTLSSRLGVRVRQKEGLTYGISSGLSVSSLDKRGLLVITAICNPTNINRVATATREEVDRLLRDGVTKEELDQARQGWLQSQKVARSSDSALAVLLNGLRFVDRTMMWDADLEKKIEALTPDQVVATLRKYVDPKKLVIVTAGDFETKATASAQ
jgi:zinc protease